MKGICQEFSDITISSQQENQSMPLRKELFMEAMIINICKNFFFLWSHI